MANDTLFLWFRPRACRQGAARQNLPEERRLPMQQLSAKQARIYEYIVERISAGRSPSLREICADLHIKSTSTVHRYLCELERLGYIERESNLNRSIALPGQRALKVPLVGTVAAGSPILAVEQIEDYITYDSLKYRSDELFALRVKGESMIEIGILDGDIIVARKISVARNGDLVVALVDDEATVKTFYKENGGFRLQPENSSMEPILVDKVTILGRVVSLMRRYE